jgi:anaerobic selenocysteine-containing dehydrogenase
VTTVTKHVVCTICDIGCQLRAEAQDGRVTRILPHEHPVLAKNVCYKGTAAPQIHNHPDRLRRPLKRVGARGEHRWEEISYAQAMDEIAPRLDAIVREHGPEALAVSTSNWNTAVENGMGRRFMNLLGTPNWISGVAMCAGNTAAVNRLTYGWMPFPDFGSTRCIVLFGHNPRRHSWTPVFNAINAARARGAKLIVLDPRVSDQAATADLHLPLRSGTDAAMCLGWLHVIIGEKLYDAEFVERWTVGFDDLRARVAEYPLERVAGITGVDAALIARAARMYATSGPAVIPWTPTTDQQVSSTSAIRLHGILRAICGHLDVVGGEQLGGFNPSFVPESRLELHEALPQAQRDKQLGADRHPVYTYRAQDLLGDATERVYGYRYANVVMGSYMANPSAVFRAMADGDPYPVKAFFVLGNNALMSYPNQQLVHRALLAQDLIVAHELFLTPTAQLADYVLPGDVFTERNNVNDSWSWTTALKVSERVVDPPGECTSVFQFWRDLALRMGMEAQFPWRTLDEVLDHRCAPMGRTFAELADETSMRIEVPEFRSYRTRGFATPSGKVELRSSVLEQLGFDPLPYHREPPAPSEEYPLRVFVGVREDAYFQTGQRNIETLRRRSPVPKTFLHPTDAAEAGVADGDWVRVESAHGAVVARVEVHDTMREGHVRVPHGWWFPELTPDPALSGAFLCNDGMLVADDAEHLDAEQGTPHFKGFPGRVVRLDHVPDLPAAVLDA